MPTRIQSDVITVVPIEFDNLAGSAVPAPSGGTTSVNNDNDAACSASIETEADGSLVLVLTPAQPPQDGAICNISVSDTVGGQSITTPTVDFELTADTQAANAHLDTTHMSTRPLPAPPTP